MYNHILPRVNSQQDFLHACNIYLPINVCKIDFEIPGYLKAYCEGYNWRNGLTINHILVHICMYVFLGCKHVLYVIIHVHQNKIND